MRDATAIRQSVFIDWDGIVALWSNYDAKERYAMCYNYEEVVDVLKSAMNEGDGPESKLQWWFDWDNDVVCVIYPPRAVHR